MRPRAPTSRPVRLSLWPLGIAYGTAGVAVAAHHGDVTTYAGSSAALAGAELAAGWILIAAGLMTWARRPGGVAGPVAVAGGFAWFAPDWAGWQLGPGAVRSAGLLLAGVVLALMFHLTLAGPTGHAAAAAGRTAVAGMYGAAGALVLGRLLFYDPFADPDCWRDCVGNAFLVHGDARVAVWLDAIETVIVLLAPVLLLGLAALHLRDATGLARRAAWPVFAAGVLFAIADAAHAFTRLRVPLEDPGDSGNRAVFLARCAGAIALGLALLWSLARTRMARSALAHLIRDLGAAPAPGLLEDAIGRIAGDPALRVAYPRTSGDGYIDAEGVALPPEELDRCRAITPILRGGEPVAVVLHADASSLGAQLVAEIGAAARLGVENERLQAEARAQLRELRASHARIVEGGDAARHRLERDLHDGAQQRLVGVALALRLARTRLAGDANVPLGRLLVHADQEVRVALSELRELARGLYPAALAEEGLAAAIDVLIESAATPVEARLELRERLAAEVEATAYRVVAEALDNVARHASATHAVVDVRQVRGQLVVEVTDDGAGGAAPERGTGLADLEDRLTALDGRLVIHSPPSGGTRIRASIPCAS